MIACVIVLALLTAISIFKFKNAGDKSVQISQVQPARKLDP
ncbi:hypothetical protein AB434_3593 [Heyndrickxia coagulans]|uniref:Uncharacterized protein n=3 Tax=Heyndrickxia coagulans TaxID=1398 RepID=G2TM37_HEYCO|nr:hypothetical protein Bcoa_2695 [Heyndrickxia coagulans 36D1]AJO22477.1 hypothetical protein SB48_HM08orf02667 [Heyndrickxia coagulans]AKN55998.1 hypothetical protein AB434_3593 [Heyndrickxia coagulans]KYC61822.1 hypothetical protein B4100_2961 [Heyndrickxia coagulans]